MTSNTRDRCCAGPVRLGTTSLTFGGSTVCGSEENLVVPSAVEPLGENAICPDLAPPDDAAG